MVNQKYYIYKFVDEDESVLYVGKTKRLDSRIYSHIKDKKWLKSGVKLYCSEVKNPTDMDIYETYYINKLKPRYNKLKVYHAEFTQKIDNLNFILHRELKESDFTSKVGSYSYRPMLCGTESDQILEHSGLPVWQEINIHQSICFDMIGFLHETDIAKDYALSYITLTTGERIFSFSFEMHNNTRVDINLAYDPDTIIDIPEYIYYDAFLPILQRHTVEFISDYNYLLWLDELIKEEGGTY